MRQLILYLCVLAVICAVSHAKHMHPRSAITIEEETGFDAEMTRDIDGIHIDVIRNIKPNRFVPVNNILFFRRYPPCEDGFKRDLLGVCREVWD